MPWESCEKQTLNWRAIRPAYVILEGFIWQLCTFSSNVIYNSQKWNKSDYLCGKECYFRGLYTAILTKMPKITQFTIYVPVQPCINLYSSLQPIWFAYFIKITMNDLNFLHFKQKILFSTLSWNYWSKFHSVY